MFNDPSLISTAVSRLTPQEKMIEIADNIICPSRYEYDNFTRYFPYFSGKVALIENTIEVFPPDNGEIQDIKSQYKIKENDVVSIYVGQLERIKGADVLLQHLPKVLNRHKNLKIFVIGKSLKRSYYNKMMEIQKRFPRNLFYIKYLEKKTLFQYYFLSHIYINPSLSESFSLSTHEGALCRNALLLNSIPVFDKFKGAALFFSNHDTNGNGFISRYEYLIKNKKFRERISNKSARIAKDFLAKNRLKKELSMFFKNSKNRNNGRSS